MVVFNKFSAAASSEIMGLLLAGFWLLPAATSIAQDRPGSDGPLAQILQELVQKQAAAWNRGDWDAFMEPYWKSEQLTFSSGGTVRRGWRQTRENYLRRYPDRKAMGQVTFSQLEVTELGSQAALMLGRWRLDREHPVAGGFTLVFRKIDGAWRIIHDHTSKDQADGAADASEVGD